MYYFIKVIKAATPLSNSDFFSETDASVMIECDSKKRITTIIENNNNPVWNEIFLIEGRCKEIKISLIDNNKWSKDKTLKREMLPISDEGELIKSICCGIELEHGYIKLNKAKDYMKTIENLGTLSQDISDIVLGLKYNISNLIC